MKCCNDKLKGEIVGSVLVSFSLLMLFFALEVSPQSKMLDIEPLWVLIAFIPLIITMIFSGVIRGFKGLGVELEFSKTIEELNLNIPIELVLAGEGSSSLKDNQQVLKDLKEQGSLDKIKVIQFFIGNNYDPKLTFEYFRAFSNLEYIEILNKKKEFKGLFYFTEIFKKCKEYDDDDLRSIEKFIGNLENNSLKNDYRDKYIVDKIKKNDTVLDVYKQFNKSKSQVLPIIECNKMVGVVSRCQVNEQIARKAISVNI